MFELKSTDENIENSLITNSLDRNKTVFQFLKILYSLKEQYSLCIDGNWGTGKTFFVKQCMKTIALLNMEEATENLKEYKTKLDNEFAEIQVQNEIFPVYFNAWEYDSNRDPLIAFIYSLINDINLDLSISKDNEDTTIIDKLKKLMSSFKFGTTITDEKTGMSYGAEIQYTPTDNPNILKEVTSIKNIEENFKGLLNDILPERANRVVIFIQDMDIKLLLNDLYDNLFIKANVNYDTMMMNGKICIEQINVNTLKMMLSFINDIITLS